MTKIRGFGAKYFVAAVLSVLVAGAGFILATEKSAMAQASASPMKISPVRTEATAKPGESIKVPVYITNISKVPVALKAIENDFVAGDEKGTPSIILNENSYAPSHSLKRFMQPISNVTVEPGATKQVDVTINVPKNAQAGGYFGALRFAPVDANGNASVSLTGSISSLILLTVPGDLVERLVLTNFDIQQKGAIGTNFRTSDNLEVALRFQNDGNVHLAPHGKINVIKGKKTIYSADFNDSDSKGNVLPDSARKWTVPLKGMGKFGKYKVVGTFTYGADNKSIEVEKSIWIVPTVYVIAAVSGLIGLAALVVFIRLFLKSYKKKVLRGHRR
jgi:hypothetical protein